MHFAFEKEAEHSGILLAISPAGERYAKLPGSEDISSPSVVDQGTVGIETLSPPLVILRTQCYSLALEILFSAMLACSLSLRLQTEKLRLS